MTWWLCKKPLSSATRSPAPSSLLTSWATSRPSPLLVKQRGDPVEALLCCVAKRNHSKEWRKALTGN
eukprot:3129530-Amphidinium_carterae.1